MRTRAQMARTRRRVRVACAKAGLLQGVRVGGGTGGMPVRLRNPVGVGANGSSRLVWPAGA